MPNSTTPTLDPGGPLLPDLPDEAIDTIRVELLDFLRANAERCSGYGAIGAWLTTAGTADVREMLADIERRAGGES